MTDRTAPPPVQSSYPRIPRGLALTGLATSMFLIILDTAMVNLAGSAIRDGLGLTSGELAIVVDSYLVAFAGLLLLGGRLADVLGARRVFMAGMLVYLAACALCALAVSGPMLIAGRIGQGIGAATVVPSSLALMLAIYETPAARTRALGIWGIVSGAGSLLGIFIGGVLTQTIGWQSVFWAPVPFGILSMLIVMRTVPSFPGRPGRFDLPGAIAITVGVSALAFGMVAASEAGWSNPATLIGIPVGFAAIAAFIAAERRSTHPLVPLSVFRRGPVVTASAVMALLGATLTSLFFFLPLYQQDVLGMTAAEAGTAQTPIAVMLITCAGFAPMLTNRIGLGRALPVALVLLLAGILWLALNPVTSGYSVHLFGSFTLIGSGLGLGIVNATTMAVRDSGEGESGLLSGLVNAAQQLGSAIGLAALAGIAIGAAGAHGDIAFTTAFLSQAALMAIALVISLTARGKSRQDTLASTAS
ncbi:MFS transporter [Glycomyces harbinensis]|uniref:Drug resistance transporter, EmrB/QacA subfamily n=1 Tax=Glycomyces harbinensis TaxID=58114 RepID=A0A1G6ZM29_9ACTN|nr:MFS transporter [Glycomyces harbinensis]SDE03473.1 drug resistance transporter, EmrB/QacA subfamily [Glycomyces harbinensis]